MAIDNCEYCKSILGKLNKREGYRIITNMVKLCDDDFLKAFKKILNKDLLKSHCSCGKSVNLNSVVIGKLELIIRELEISIMLMKINKKRRKDADNGKN